VYDSKKSPRLCFQNTGDGNFQFKRARLAILSLSSCIGNAQQIPVGIFEPCNLDFPARRSPDSKLIVRDMREALEGQALLVQRSHSRSDVGHRETKNRVPVRREISHVRNAQRDSASAEHRSEFIFVRQFQPEDVAIERRGTRAISGANNNGRLRQCENAHSILPLRRQIDEISTADFQIKIRKTTATKTKRASKLASLALRKIILAATYDPTQLPVQYHRRCGA
jgi:hypothetical protein